MIIRQPYPNELYHHGIKGMSWGVRRFQNEDGSLTEAGRRRYGILGRLVGGPKKKKISRAAKIRAKQRTKAKTDEAKKAALEAETARLNAQREAEEAKTRLRAAKKENSLLNRAVKALPKKEPKEKVKEKPIKESKNSKKLAAAIEAGNDKKVSKILESLDNEEYAKALERINMKYEMSLAKKKYSTEKMKQTVEKFNQIASSADKAVSIYNVVAGVASVVSGKDVPKINTKPTDPLKTAEQLYKNRTQKATAEKAEALAKQENMKAQQAGILQEEFMKEHQKPKEKQESKPVDDKLSNEAKNAIKDLIGNKNKSDKKRNPLEDFISPGAAKDAGPSQPKRSGGNKGMVWGKRDTETKGPDISTFKPKPEKKAKKKYKKGQNITKDNWEDFFEQMNEKLGPKVKDSDILNARIVNPKRGKAAKDDPNKTYGRPADIVDIIPEATFLPVIRPNGQIDVSSLPKGQQDMFWRFMNGV